MLNVRTRVVDSAMRDVPQGERGEIVHRSPQLMLGYWGKPRETADAFAGGWFHKLLKRELRLRYADEAQPGSGQPA